VIQRLIEEAAATSVLAVDCKPEFIAKLSQCGGRSTIGFFSRDEDARTAYVAAARAGASVLPLVMDFVEPTPARGLASHRCIAASERFRCDLVVAPGLLEDVALRYRRITLEDVAAGLAMFANRWAIVDFRAVREPSAGDFTLERALAALSSHFAHVRPVACGAEFAVVCEK
jgi:hypothetical protein